MPGTDPPRMIKNDREHLFSKNIVAGTYEATEDTTTLFWNVSNTRNDGHSNSYPYSYF